MSHHERDLSPDWVIGAMVTNLQTYVADMVSAVPGAELLPLGGRVGYRTDHRGARFNGVVQPRFSPHTVDAEIVACIARARARGGGLLWWLPPGSAPADLEDRLLTQGFTCLDRPVGMAVRLDRLQAEPLPAGVTMQRVTEQALLRTWAAVGCAAYGLPASYVDPIMQIYEADGLGERARSGAYLAFLDGVPVATAGVIFGGGVAGIYLVATAAAARGRGIGRAVTLAPLLDASARGYRVGVLFATEMGASVYRRLGFEEYCVVPQYLWRDEPATTPS